MQEAKGTILHLISGSDSITIDLVFLQCDTGQTQQIIVVLNCQSQMIQGFPK